MILPGSSPSNKSKGKVGGNKMSQLQTSRRVMVPSRWSVFSVVCKARRANDFKKRISRWLICATFSRLPGCDPSEVRSWAHGSSRGPGLNGKQPAKAQQSVQCLLGDCRRAAYFKPLRGRAEGLSILPPKQMGGPRQWNVKAQTKYRDENEGCSSFKSL